MFPLTAGLKIADTKTTYLYCSVSSCTQPSIILITGVSGTLHGDACTSSLSPTRCPAHHTSYKPRDPHIPS